ncbi:MAG: hypothetical protein H0T73_08185, partial [Ardenticatenales bacterium]|nr:hypothetical protein [Ardenticatenales bacterium]
LDHALQDVLAEWPTASASLELDRGSGSLFYQPSDSLVRLVPEAPMGAVLGFQYYDVDSTGDGSLRFFHIRGVGRDLLLHLHDALSASDGKAGPQVILTSSTSWAPGSWRYHLDTPPGAILLPSRAEERATVECFFSPILDPEINGKTLYVSGRHSTAERLRNLRAMTQHLTRPEGPYQSPFDEEFTRIKDEERKRILILVARYDEAEEVARVLAETLAEVRGTAVTDEVVALVPDRQGEGEWAWKTPRGQYLRSMLPRFSKYPAHFLVAPLQAIERGHNILVGQSQRAAFGSVYFFVRPVPHPGDLHTAVHRINRWSQKVVPTLEQGQIAQTGHALRQRASFEWDKLLRERETYREASDRKALLWTQLVLVWQCIGRLLRGGVHARVHFIDAKWAEATARLLNQAGDTEQTSMLLGFERILNEALADPDPAHRALAEALYGPFATALQEMKSVHRANA